MKKKPVLVAPVALPYSRLDVNGTFYKGYFCKGKKCGEGTLDNHHKRTTMKGIWMDGSCVTSILQDETTDPIRQRFTEVSVRTITNVSDQFV